MIKNMKIRKSLILGYGVTIIVSVVIIIAAIIMMTVQKGAYQNIINTNIRASELVTECRLNSNVAARDLRDVVLSYSGGAADPAYVRETLAEARADISNLNSLQEQLDSIYPLDKALLRQYSNLVDEWELVAENIAQNIEQGNISEAARLITASCTPKLNSVAEVAREMAAKLDEAEAATINSQNLVSNIGIIVIAVALVIAILIVIRMALVIIRSIVEPASQVHAALEGFSQGKLDVPVEYRSTSELGDMCEALRTSQNVLGECIGDTCRLLEEMGNGNFDVRSKDANMYVGSLSSILSSVRVINRSLSDALAQINQSAEQVSAGAEQVSTGAQSLAQGATEQASAVEELSATIAEISSNSRKNAQNSEEAMGHSKDASERISESAEYMQQMVQAMERISESSAEIAKIIDTIENIAFQTNILALNAAVEAARAGGAAGKGFAVVADEVRNLAAKSDQAAKATKDLIDRSINSVKDGNDIVKRVSESLDKTVESSGKVSAAVMEITKAAEEESEAIAQVTEGIDQISSVVQTNSATSEQSAAASEELSSQAALMKELLSRFKLRQDGYTPGRAAQPSYSPASYESVSEPTSSQGAASVFSKY